MKGLLTRLSLFPKPSCVRGCIVNLFIWELLRTECHRMQDVSDVEIIRSEITIQVKNEGELTRTG